MNLLEARKFVVVGGGTAGWLAALMLQQALAGRVPAATVTVVESSRIPTIGVGEGTTAVFRQMLKQFGFDEFAFLRETEATIKFGIRHRDWRRKGHHYDGPIDDPHLVVDPPAERAASYLDIFACAAGRKLSDTHLFGHLLAGSRAPFARGRDGKRIAMGPFHHAFHFDQAKAGQWLRKHAKGVATIDAQVNGVTQDAVTGHITQLHSDVGDIEGDFFVDCTGFRRTLIGAMGAKWISYAGELPVNRAMPFWLDLEEGEEVSPFTHAWAQGSGWLWQIPTQKRVGCGYVYCDQFQTPEGAQAEIETVLGRKIEPRNDIKIDAGRVDRAMIGNCLALGLSSSFLEPLEATSIHGTITQLMVFTMRQLQGKADADDYNAFVARQLDDFRNFINLHYVSERRDTPFWTSVAHDSISHETRARLEGWQKTMPSAADFTPLPGHVAHVEQQLYYPVLDGLGLLNRRAAQAHMEANPALRARAKQAVDGLTRQYIAAAPKALSHREFLRTL